ncbi:MAG: sugar ABC transporter permease [Actinomycetota bacterium]|nr:sugar ABC transporter permease [Actinomycetota bacterium]
MTTVDTRGAEPATGAPTTKKRGGADRSEARIAWLFLAPAGILLLLFIVAPFVLAIIFSFTNQRLISPLPTKFIGLDNYVGQLTDGLFWKSLWNNARFSIFVVPFQTAFALFLAVLVNQKIRGKTAFRTIFFTPVTVVMAAAATIWVLLFNANGLVNAALELITFGNFSPDWLNSTTWAMPAIIIVSVWQGVGFQMIILLAALQDVPSELYEAASIDGATTWEQFMNVTLPGIRNPLIFVVTVTTILAMRLFDQPMLMPNAAGGPLDSTRTAMVHMVDIGFSRQNIGRGSAIAVIFFVIVLGLTLLQRRFLKEEGEV